MSTYDSFQPFLADTIKGGGYGVGNGRQDLTQIITSNNNSFVGVAIQYRVSENLLISNVYQLV